MTVCTSTLSVYTLNIPDNLYVDYHDCFWFKIKGQKTILGMLLHDEIRGRLCEVFSLKSYKIDHVVHGAVATAVVYGTMMGATAQQIESAVGMVRCTFLKMINF